MTLYIVDKGTSNHREFTSPKDALTYVWCGVSPYVRSNPAERISIVYI